MSISLATHLKTSRHGIFYFRMAVPIPLRKAMGKSELLYSLHTRDPAQAKRLSYTITSQTHVLFEKMAYDPHKFNPADVSTFPTVADSGSLRHYELELGIGGAIKIKSDNENDHRRAMEALALMKSLPQAQAQAPAPQPQPYLEPQPEQTITISKALESWAATLTNKKTRKNYTSFVNRFILINGDVEVHKIRGADVVTWKAELLKKLAPVTVDTRLQALQSLLTWCYHHNYLSDQKPLATKGKFAMTKTEREVQTKGAERFRIEDLNKIFNPSSYAVYTTKNTGLKSEARHWIPLIGLFTGMRLEEIAQLTTIDIKNVGGVDIFDVNRNGGKSLKTAAAVRAIPIHQTLLDMGFLDYVKKLESKSLWPELKRTANGFGNPVSKAFIRHLEEVGVRRDGKDRAMVFHSLRDTFNNICEVSNGITPEVRYTLMGHEQGGSNEKNYLEPKTLQRLKNDGIDLLVYAETVAGVTHKLVL